MKLWIDEDLSPSLTTTCNVAGYLATSVRDRGKLKTKDWDLAQVLNSEDWVLVTNNAGDFLKLAEHEGVHPGLVFMEESIAAQEREWMQAAIDHIERRGSEKGESPEAFMTNRVVVVDTEGSCTDYTWP